VREDGTPYQRTKFRAEQYLAGTNLRWTIFRPSVLFGDPRGKMEFATQLYRDIIKSPLPAPLFYKGLWPSNPGGYAMSPVHVEDVADCFVSSLDDPKAVGKTYTLGGPQVLTWKEILETIAAVTGRKLFALPAPAIGIGVLASLLDRFAFFPITRDQLTMLLEGNTCDGSEAYSDFQVSPRPFSAENLRYLDAES
jgi:NADH dehydrogenase